MKNVSKFLKVIVLSSSCFTNLVFSSEAGLVIPDDEMPIYSEHRLTMSMQSGIQIYMNNCMGCHSLKFQRYNRSAKDLEISEDLMLANLVFGEQKIGDLMTNNMPIESAEKWFGTAPPDLSLIARSRNPKWLYNYLRGFYLDDARPYGVNNSIFKDVGMPHALESLQGLQDKTELVKSLENEIAYALGDIASAREMLKKDDNSSDWSKTISDSEVKIHENEAQLIQIASKGEYFTLVKQGELSPQEFDEAMADLVNFLEYVGEPIKRERKAMGIYVLLFLTFFTVLAYFLKKEYWKDIH